MQSMGKRKHREEKVGQDTWKGSYTVEAAVILPLTALILAAVILAAFYIHETEAVCREWHVRLHLQEATALHRSSAQNEWQQLRQGSKTAADF